MKSIVKAREAVDERAVPARQEAKELFQSVIRGVCQILAVSLLINNLAHLVPWESGDLKGSMQHFT